MAESIIFAVAGNMITKMGSLALRELGLSWRINDELDKLQGTLSAIRAVLLDAEEQQSKSHAVKDWISKLKDVFYDIDDLVDELSYETLKKQVLTESRRTTKHVRIFFSKFHQISFGLKMGQQIKEVREKLNAIADDKDKLHLSMRMGEIQGDELRKIRETSSFIPEGEVIGRDDDKKVIIDFLLDTKTKKDNVEVISIVGMGGLGKTALAQSVYNDEKINKHFQLKLWVCISEEFNVRTIVGNIIELFEEKKLEPLQLDKLQSMLREKINGKRYLLVMDDVWNESHEKWIDLKRYLIGGAMGSRILITTRSQQVAQTSDTDSFHHLKELDNHNSWVLFRKMAFLNEEEEIENLNLVKIGKEIVAKLKGSPLGIRVVGRLLYFQNTEKDWLSFKDHNELGTTLQQENQIQQILKISFDHLPSNLKRCFMYCSLFPKDYEFRKDELVKLWMAQGFIQPHDEKAIEDVGDDYFKELLGRSFFQDIRKNKWGDIKKCKMHDLIHDLALLMVENECVVVNDGVGSIDKRTRHVSFLYNGRRPISRELVPRSFTQAKKLRTLDLTFNSISSLKKYHINLFRLRTLNLDRCCCHPPKFIDKLKHLRYLNLSDLDVRFLPTFITKLYNLETLILCYCNRLRELPKDISNLMNLRHLDLQGCSRLTHMPKGLGGMSSLQTMNLFVLGKDKGGNLSELNGLKSLRGSLCIRGLQFCTTIDIENVKYFEEKSEIRKLKLHWDTDKMKPKIDDASYAEDERILECLKPHSNVRKMSIKGYRGMKLCDWVSPDYFLCVSPDYFQGGLVSIELCHCEKLEHLPQVDQFPYLKNLHLEDLSNIEYIDDTNSVSSSTTFFPSLEKLRIKKMPKLKGWWRRGEIPSNYSAQYTASLPTALHQLSQLWILDCPQLAFIPQHPPLQSLAIGGVGLKVFDMVIRMATNLAADSSSSSTLSKLSTLEIENIDIKFLPEALNCNMKDLESLTIRSCKYLQMSSSRLVYEEDDRLLYWKELSNLRKLRFGDIPKLEYLPKGLEHLTALESLLLIECGNLVSIEGIGQLSSLSDLRIMDCPKLRLLPEEIGHLVSLSHLSICKCHNLTSLPEGVCGLTSLSYLSIYDCPNLRTLPEGLSQIRSLKGSLYVFKCPKLRKSWKKQNKYRRLKKMFNLDNKQTGEDDRTEITFGKGRRSVFALIAAK
ncbi:disease resistance protein RGA2-like [Cucumis melo var. makuwa]|uniref:Disease resistance protein RGA2-like n=1 Tax=Cucumis melo var. makuwa TaxID=1194695 RepID=A0A5A7UTV6_CUCMM|nr:disease resistance protein RGA2-like [Cucumis melo var. makuwa]